MPFIYYLSMIYLYRYISGIYVYHLLYFINFITALLTIIITTVLTTVPDGILYIRFACNPCIHAKYWKHWDHTRNSLFLALLLIDKYLDRVESYVHIAWNASSLSISNAILLPVFWSKIVPPNITFTSRLYLSLTFFTKSDCCFSESYCCFFRCVLASL